MTQNVKIMTYVLIALLVIVGGYFGYQWREKRRAAAYRESFSSGRGLFERGDVKSLSEAAREFEDTLRRATSPQEEGLAKLNLGVATMLIDPPKGISILKEVVADESYPGMYRAGGVVYILDYYNMTYDKDFARKYIFSGGELWESFIKGGDITEALRSAYEYSQQFWRTVTADYRLAYWYGNRLIEEASGLRTMTSEQKTVYTQRMRENLQDGDRLLAVSLRSTDVAAGGLSEFNRVLVFTVRGIAYAELYLLRGGSENKQLAEESFDKAIQQGGAISDNPYGRDASLYARFFYSVFLSVLTERGFENRSVDMKKQITALVAETDRSLSFFGFLRRLASLEYQNDLFRRYTLSLAQQDERFKALLKELGWQL
ncbi:hypothetical protein HYT04_02300 [Candidatus Kaiserbacteria bacterium]|nr:hypothetical protein [Candidatus Kaiserbacteria bacterium]